MEENMSTAYTDSGPLVRTPPPKINLPDPILLEKRTHQVFVEQLAEILDCPAQASSVIEAAIRLKEEHRRLYRSRR
jgi:hypothetical protein